MKKIMHILAGTIIILGLSYLIWWDIQNTEIFFFQAFILAQVISGLVVGLLAWRTYVLSKRKVLLLTALHANSLALAGSIFVPAKLSEFAKPLYFKRISNLQHSYGMAVVIKERVWDMVGLTLVSLFGLLFAKEASLIDSLFPAVLFLSFLSIIAFFVVLAVPYIIKSFLWLKKLDAFAQAMKQNNWWENLVPLFLSVSIWFGSFGTLYIFYNASGLPELSFFQLLLVFIASTLGLIITITPGGVGTYEGTIVILLANFGIEWNAALVFAIGFRFCWMFIPLMIAIWAIIYDRYFLIKSKKE